MREADDIARSLDEATEMLTRAAELAKRVRDLLDDPQETTIEEECSRIRIKHEFPMKVAVLGAVSCGKSSFLNALTGRFRRIEKIVQQRQHWVYSGPLPTSRHVKTAVPSQIRASREGEGEYALLEFAGGEKRRVSLEEAEDYVSLDAGKTTLAEKVANFLKRARLVTHATFVIETPAWLRRIVLMDTPGLDSRAEGHAEAALASVKTADAVLYLVRDIIIDADRRALIDVKDYISNLVFVQTKADQEPLTVNSRMESNARAVATWLNVDEPRFFPVSSHLEMARLSGDGVLDSGFRSLRSEIERIIDASVEERLAALRIRTARSLRRLSDVLAEKLVGIGDDADADLRRMEALREMLASAPALAAELDRRYDDAKREIVEWLSQEREAWIAEMTAATWRDRRSADACSAVLQQYARLHVFESEIRPHVKRRLSAIQSQTVKDLGTRLGAMLTAVDVETGKIRLDRPIIRSNVIARFFRWLAQAEIPEHKIRESAAEAYDQMHAAVSEKVDEVVSRLKKTRAQCQRDQEQKLTIRSNEAAAKAKRTREDAEQSRRRVLALIEDLDEELNRLLAEAA